MTEETKEQEAGTVAGGQNERLVMHCSFCGTSNNDKHVKKMIAGDDSCICDNCVYQCLGILLGKAEQK